MKHEALKKPWCKKYSFTFVIIDDDWFIKNISTELFTGNEHLISPMKKFL